MDLKLKDVAEMLNVSETTIRRWLADNKIPAYKLQHQYRFDRAEIENWVMQHKLKDETGISPFSQNPKADSLSVATGGLKQYGLTRAIKKGGVFNDIAGKTKEEVIRNTAHRIAPILEADEEVLAEFLLDREKLQPTALGHGIAVPHTRDLELNGDQEIVAVVYPEKPVDWKALDNKPVSTLFFLFTSDNKTHLHLLAKIAYLSSHQPALELLNKKPSKEELLEFMTGWESEIRSTL
ncbi:MAG: PTS sugar transporter subunit IIA [Chlamydiia bacterium]|nr:PTS sugar transporter subunit IIA [Chlamydiia bacterium]